MSIVALPAGLMRPATFKKWLLLAPGQVYSSPLTQQTQTVGLPGAAWSGTLEWPNLTRAQWRYLEAFRASLRGMSGRFYLGPIHAAAPFGPVPGAPLVQGAAQTGGSLLTRGWGAGAPVLDVGDYFCFDSAGWRELKQVTASPGVADGSGLAALTFEPPIRNAPDDGAPLTIRAPTCVVGLATPQEAAGDFTAPAIGAFTLNFVERFR